MRHCGLNTSRSTFFHLIVTRTLASGSVSRSTRLLFCLSTWLEFKCKVKAQLRSYNVRLSQNILLEQLKVFPNGAKEKPQPYWWEISVWEGGTALISSQLFRAALGVYELMHVEQNSSCFPQGVLHCPVTQHSISKSMLQVVWCISGSLCKTWAYFILLLA